MVVRWVARKVGEKVASRVATGTMMVGSLADRKAGWLAWLMAVETVE